MFEQSDGTADHVSAKELGELLGNSQRREQPNSESRVVLVILSACKSGISRSSESVFNGVAQNLISQGIPAVVAMQYSIRVHQFSRDLVETALYESPLQPEKVNVIYFHNVPGASVYKDLYLTEPITLQTVLKSCDNQTSILIVSDAGAARGYRELKRIRATTRFLFTLKQYSALIAWLNPMPEPRWLGSSAEIIANLVPMYEMDRTGLSNAIDIIRGQPLF